MHTHNLSLSLSLTLSLSLPLSIVTQCLPCSLVLVTPFSCVLLPRSCRKQDWLGHLTSILISSREELCWTLTLRTGERSSSVCTSWDCGGRSKRGCKAEETQYILSPQQACKVRQEPAFCFHLRLLWDKNAQQPKMSVEFIVELQWYALYIMYHHLHMMSSTECIRHSDCKCRVVYKKKRTRHSYLVFMIHDQCSLPF